MSPSRLRVIGVGGVLLSILALALFVLRSDTLRPVAPVPGIDNPSEPEELQSLPSEDHSVGARTVSRAEPLAGLRGQITVSVVDDALEIPIPRAEVEWVRGSENERLRCDDSGRLQFDPSRLHDAGLIARAENYFPSGLSPEEVRTCLGVKQVVQLRLRRSGSVDIVVVDASTGQPLSGVRVSASIADSATGAKSSRQPYFWPYFVGANRVVSALVSDSYVPSFTDESGVCRIDSLPIATRMVITADETVLPVSGVVSIPEGSRRADLLLRARAGCSVRGRLLAGPDAPLPQVGVRLLSHGPEGAVLRRASTDENGRFVIHGMPDSGALLSVEGHDLEPIKVECVVGDADLGDLELKGLCRLTGLVAWSSPVPPGTGVPSHVVRILPQGRPAIDARPDADGRFAAYVRSGPCVVALSNHAQVLEQVALSLPTGDQVVFDASRHYGAVRLTGDRFEYDPGFEMRLWGLEAAPESAGPIVGIRAGLGQYARIEDGEWFLTPVLPGTYRAAARLGHGQGWVELGVLDVEAGSTTIRSLSRTEMHCSGKLAGIVTDEAGAPVANLLVQATQQCSATTDDPGQRLTTTTDDQGRFSWSGLSCGEWIVFPESLGHRSASGQVTRVQASESAWVRIHAGAPAEIEVVVASDEGPVSGARIKLTPRGESYAQANARHEVTDEQGRTRLDGLAPGAYAVSCVVRAGERMFHQTRHVIVSPGQREVLGFRTGVTPVRVRVGSAGVLLDDVLSAHFVSERGMRKGTMTEDPREVLFDPEPGEWIVLVTRTSSYGSAPRPQGMTIARLVVPAGAFEEPLVAEVGDGRIVLELEPDANPWIEPRARLISAAGVDLTLAPGQHPPLLPEAERSGQLVFHGLPTPCRVRLEGPAGSKKAGTFVVDISLDTSEERRQRWPPGS